MRTMPRIRFISLAAAMAIGVVLAAGGEAMAQNRQLQQPASRSTATELIQMCGGDLPTPSTPAVGVLACRSFLSGFLDYHAIAALRNGYRPFCVPEGLTPERLQQEFTDHVRGNPRLAGEHRSFALFDAMVSRFPCPTAPEDLLGEDDETLLPEEEGGLLDEGTSLLR